MFQYAEYELVFMYRRLVDGLKISGKKEKTQFVKISKGNDAVSGLK